MYSISKWLIILTSGLIGGFSCNTLAQSPPAEIDLPPNTQELLEQTIPQLEQPLQPQFPQLPPKSNLQIPNISKFPHCPISTLGERFFVKDVRVLGNTVLETEINQIIQPFKRRTATFSDLICLRSQITQLYIENDYVTSGAFLVNNQDLSDGIVQIQVVEGELERIEITGLKRLQESYIRSRLEIAATKPLNRKRLEQGLQLLILNPLIDTVNAELTAGQKPGNNVLLLNIQQAQAFSAGLAVDNYRAPSIGEIQGSIEVAHNNLLGFGDRISAEYSVTEGLDIYNLSYAIPWNPYDGTLSFSYDNSDSKIVDEEFRDLDIESETETLSFGLRQPLFKSPNQEFTFGLSLDVRRRRTFLQGEPFSFSLGVEDGKSNVTVIRFSQDWLNRSATKVLAARSRSALLSARSQFNIGIDAFDATINDTGVDGNFFAWQGQFQWVQQLSSRVLLITRVGGQFSPDSLLSLEKFSLGGINSVRGYRENQLVTDSGILGGMELRIPVTSNPNTLQLNPFIEFGKGWNQDEPDPDNATIASLGLGLRWSIDDSLSIRLDYGIPLIDVDNEGDSLQENGFHFFLRYQPFN
ncbi:MAG: ShlB/FhaC/HecB family hemolysin secretion/activation protein [Xenococcaceae cyanobacterium MO_188.B19]|nr:ShlB/FhaC/HecB family hemolysin secretion/activation protein [Xenococcaceae cyanobacterium MO_188.B19]